MRTSGKATTSQATSSNFKWQRAGVRFAPLPLPHASSRGSSKGRERESEKGERESDDEREGGRAAKKIIDDVAGCRHLRPSRITSTLKMLARAEATPSVRSWKQRYLEGAAPFHAACNMQTDFFTFIGGGCCCVWRRQNQSQPNFISEPAPLRPPSRSRLACCLCCKEVF